MGARERFARWRAETETLHPNTLAYRHAGIDWQVVHTANDGLSAGAEFLGLVVENVTEALAFVVEDCGGEDEQSIVRAIELESDRIVAEASRGEFAERNGTEWEVWADLSLWRHEAADFLAGFRVDDEASNLRDIPSQVLAIVSRTIAESLVREAIAAVHGEDDERDDEDATV